MEEKKTKYDTNPLDPDVERQSSETWGDGGGNSPTQPVKGATQRVSNSADDTSRRNVYSEAPTRRYESQSPPLEAPYQSVFVPPTYAPPTTQSRNSIYQSPVDTSPNHSVAGLGVPERWVTMMSYCPSYIGLVVSPISLFLVPRKEVKVRFHASQALAIQIAILIVHTLFGVISTLTGSSFGGVIFHVATLAFLIISMIRVWRGEPYRIAPVAEAAQWFNDHIEPRNQK